MCWTLCFLSYRNTIKQIKSRCQITNLVSLKNSSSSDSESEFSGRTEPFTVTTVSSSAGRDVVAVLSPVTAPSVRCLQDQNQLFVSRRDDDAAINSTCPSEIRLPTNLIWSDLRADPQNPEPAHRRTSERAPSCSTGQYWCCFNSFVLPLFYIYVVYIYIYLQAPPPVGSSWQLHNEKVKLLPFSSLNMLTEESTRDASYQ